MRHVLDAKTDCNCTTLKTPFKLHFHLGDFRVSRSSARGLTAWDKLDRVAHRGHSRREMSHTDTVVDQHLPLSLSVPTIHVARSDFQLQRRSHAIHGLETIVFFVLTMLMEIDEARRNDEAFRIDDSAAYQFGSRDRFDGPAGDTNVAHGVESRFGIDHSAIKNDDIVGLICRRGA